MYVKSISRFLATKLPITKLQTLPNPPPPAVFLPRLWRMQFGQMTADTAPSCVISTRSATGQDKQMMSRHRKLASITLLGMEDLRAGKGGKCIFGSQRCSSSMGKANEMSKKPACRLTTAKVHFHFASPSPLIFYRLFCHVHENILFHL